MKFTKFTDKVLNDVVVLDRIAAVLLDNYTVLEDKDVRMVKKHAQRIIDSIGTPEHGEYLQTAFEECTALSADIALPVMLTRIVSQNRVSITYEAHPWFEDFCATYAQLVINARARLPRED